ncbi:hypothetical protein QR680_002903 [Steinernema hermaphroditum]|uniref:C3H1-type domain-containing protein n=1 Tax=Steinernema hermaphroditum TaxID=289476 RepID=A0AA39LJ72_9BILA|nr:hypothetical protein QR680_002903 [Steinernema hermaphroditum]
MTKTLSGFREKPLRDSMSVSPDAPFPPHEYYSAFPAQPSAQKYQYLAALGYQHFGFEFPSCRMYLVPSILCTLSMWQRITLQNSPTSKHKNLRSGSIRTESSHPKKKRNLRRIGTSRTASPNTKNKFHLTVNCLIMITCLAAEPLHMLNLGYPIYGPSMAFFQGFPQQQGIVYYPPSMEQLMPVPLAITFPRGAENQLMQTFGGNYGHHRTYMRDFTSSYASFCSSASESESRRYADYYCRTLYKTEQCEAFRSSGECCFGDRCHFAHGEEELRPRRQPKRVVKKKKFKTKFCNNIEEYGSCRYGAKCLFIHPGDDVHKNGVQEGTFEVTRYIAIGMPTPGDYKVDKILPHLLRTAQ